MPSALSSVLRLARRAPVATLAAAGSSSSSRTHYRRRHQRHQQEQQEQQGDARECGCGRGRGRGAVALGLTIATFSQLPRQQDEPDGPAATLANVSEPDDHVLDLVDQLSAWERLDEANKALCSFRGSRHPEVLWREARLHYLQAQRLRAPGPDQQLHARLVTEGFACVQLALQLDPACGRAHQWMSVLRYARAELRGPLARLRCVDQLRQDMERAVQLLPEDGVPRTMLGMWYYEVSQLSWLERQAVKAAGQTAPGPADCLRQALHWMLEADSLYESCLNDLMLGKTLLAMGDPQRARTYVERAARRTPGDQSDVKAQLEASELLQAWKD